MKPYGITICIGLVLLSFIFTGCDLITSDTVGPDQSEPSMGISDDTLDYGLARLEADLIVYNTGGGLLQWTLSDYPGWIEPSIDQGSLNKSGADTVTLTLIRTTLNIGSNVGIINLSSNGGNLVLTLLAELSSDPVLGELPNTLAFGASTDSLELAIVNAGQGILDWTLNVNDSWLAASAYSGSAVTQDVIWLILDRENAPNGEVEAFIGINSNGGNGQIDVTAYNASTNAQWLSYCGDPDYYYVAQPEDYFYIVRFDRPVGWESFKVSRVRVNFQTLSGVYDEIQLLCWSVEESQGGLWPNLTNAGLLHQTSNLDPIMGWSEWSVDWLLNLDVFCIGYYQYDYLAPVYPRPYYDISTPTARSYIMYEAYYGVFYIDYLPDKEWCLEVFVEPTDALTGITESEGQWLIPQTALPDSTTQFVSFGHSRPISFNQGEYLKPVRR